MRFQCGHPVRLCIKSFNIKFASFPVNPSSSDNFCLISDNPVSMGVLCQPSKERVFLCGGTYVFS